MAESIKKTQAFFIMLGNACNFNCTYCLQGEHKAKIIQPEISQKLLDFLDKQDEINNIGLYFFGGEPLLYYPTIKKIVKKYKSKFRYEIISNGSLLSEKNIRFLNKYNIKLQLSHDGDISKTTRGKDVLKDKKIKSLFDKIKNRSVNVTYTSITPPIQEIIASYKEDHSVLFNIMSNTTDTEISKMYANIDGEKYRKDLEYLLQSYEDYVDGDISKRREYENVKQLLISMSIYMSEDNKTNRCYDCGRGMEMLNMDCQGNFYLCHNSNEKIGTVDEDIAIIKQRISNILYNRKEKCRKCDIRKICGGNCVLLTKGGEEQKCKLFKIFYNTVIPWIIKNKKARGL